jgi:acyl-CoA synthetase (AMP-forming)/AMP-acid ligase II
MNVFSPIRRNAHAAPDRTALIVDGKHLTYRQLVQITGAISARLAQAGVRRADVVALSLRLPGAYLLTALGVARLGGVVTPFDVSWPAEKSSAILGRHKVRALISDSREQWRHPSLPTDGYLSAKEVMEPLPAGSTIEIPSVANDVGAEPWIIALSSGTTGTPKSIPQTHDRAILTACLPTTVSPAADLSRVLVFAGASLSMAMNAILYQLIGGRTAVLTSALTPENFFTVVERDQPTHVKTSAGNAGGLVIHAAQSLADSREKCRSVRGMNIAGSAASPILRAQLEKYICPNLEINYGGSEVGRVAQATAETLAARPASAGRLRPWVEMQVVDSEDRPVPAGQFGILRVRSPLLVSGYIGDPQATARAFRDGWFYSGDTGQVDSAGYLNLAGRVDDLLNLGGTKIDPFTIEAVLDAQPGVQESAVLSVQSKQDVAVLVAVVVPNGSFDEAALRQVCGERLGVHCVPARIVTAKSIARNPAGKIMRKEMAARLQSGPRPSAGSPTPD